MGVADGIATFWTDKVLEMRKQFMTERTLPVVVLIPFAQSRTDFFSESAVSSLDELRRRVEILEEAGFDEVMVAYGERADLETAAKLINA